MNARTFWTLQLAGWAAYAVVHFLAALPVVGPGDHGTLAVIKLLRAITGLGISSLLPFALRRVTHRGPGVVAALTLLAATAAFFAWTTLDRVLLVTTANVAGLTIDWNWFPRGVELEYGFVLLLWCGAWLAFHYAGEASRRRREALEVELALRRAQLDALQNQLRPHFLFNALNSLRSLIAEDSGRAREMVTRLAQFLNASLAAESATTLEEELRTIGAYLAIQKVRFEDTLEVEIEADPAGAACRLPSMVLQPLVENAIQHGRAPEGEPLRVRVRTEFHDHRLTLTVLNPGRLPVNGVSRGIGLANTRARLARFYATEPVLELKQDGGWVRAEIRVDHPERSCEP